MIASSSLGGALGGHRALIARIPSTARAGRSARPIAAWSSDILDRPDGRSPRRPAGSSIRRLAQIVRASNVFMGRRSGQIGQMLGSDRPTRSMVSADSAERSRGRDSAPVSAAPSIIATALRLSLDESGKPRHALAVAASSTASSHVAVPDAGFDCRLAAAPRRRDPMPCRRSGKDDAPRCASR